MTPHAGLSTLGWLGSYIPLCPMMPHTSKGHGTFILENTGICWTLIPVQTCYTLSLARSTNTVIVPSKQIMFYILSVHRRQHHTHNDINLQCKDLLLLASTTAFQPLFLEKCTNCWVYFFILFGVYIYLKAMPTVSCLGAWSASLRSTPK